MNDRLLHRTDLAPALADLAAKIAQAESALEGARAELEDCAHAEPIDVDSALAAAALAVDLDDEVDRLKGDRFALLVATRPWRSR